MKKSIAFILVALSTLSLFAQSSKQKPLSEYKLTHKVNDKSAPIVYFTKDVSAEGLLKVYNALNQQLKGKVGIKVSFGGNGEQYLDPTLMTELVKKTNGTFLDTSGLSSSRGNAEKNYALARQHGFDKVAPLDMIDEDGDIDMPVNGGYHLTYTRTGSHFDNYDTLIAVHRFKAHYIQQFGGNLKNISLCLGSLSGKALIHSAGASARYYQSLANDITAQGFADAAKAAMDYKKGRWAFINVMDSFEPTDSCSHTENLGDIGIIASLDPVAIDQASCDFEFGSTPNALTRAAWETYHSVELLEYAENIGVGKRNYQLISLD